MTKVIGHRGARGLAAENTLAAIEQALAAGVDAIEIDVRVTADNIPVLVHNPAIESKGEKLLIARTSFAKLQQIMPGIITLEQAIRAVNKRSPMMVEVKPKVALEPIIAAITKILQDGWQTQDFFLSSKSQRTLMALHRAFPRLATVVIEPFLSVRAVWRARQLNTKNIAMNQHFMWFGFVSAMNRRGYHLSAYTINDARKAERWSKRGLAAVITDHPDRMRSAFPTRKTEKTNAR
ncbi:MAG TPA: glycerophosphodiester phosphodiesterase [Candidatus Saccharimonadales bacterium]|nr:glycerophosphodiester phosphodiesterase [Candidatus Saccharimonadales bacterium]